MTTYLSIFTWEFIFFLNLPTKKLIIPWQKKGNKFRAKKKLSNCLLKSYLLFRYKTSSQLPLSYLSNSPLSIQIHPKNFKHSNQSPLWDFLLLFSKRECEQTNRNKIYFHLKMWVRKNVYDICEKWQFIRHQWS